jgi:hypothetical protein
MSLFTQLNAPFAVGRTTTDEGLLNNYAIEPDIYPSGYLSPRWQHRYFFWE